MPDNRVRVDGEVHVSGMFFAGLMLLIIAMNTCGITSRLDTIDKRLNKLAPVERAK